MPEWIKDLVFTIFHLEVKKFFGWTIKYEGWEK
jgi:hypothetical protein